ncbi:PadR family transcriptional regulator [Ornithinicoccus halotolerans]|uniref:PadR family transcriptional regulator n=1 Tax=Ornithinicoccus halotolerans TaxID=1748220 RepID=UPI001295F6D4|nr:PadR family transcriptional regulator [Ornithinicoccus halotolerans]
MARPSKTRFAILGMLTMEPMTGYRLRETIAASAGHFWQESFGQLYPTLHALEREGLIAARRTTGRGGHKLEYSINDAGWDALRSWLASEAESLASNRSELLLQLFFGRHAPPGVVVGHLERHRATLLAAREQYREFERAVLAERSPDRPYWLATIRHGLAMTEAGLAWADETMADVREAGKESDT